MVSINDILKLRKNKPANENKIISEAYQLASKAHFGQTRASGVPYTKHLLEVGLFLAKWKRDHEVIVAGILHDIVEDTNISLADVRKGFGKRIANLVDGASWIRRRKKGKLRKDWPATYKKIINYAKEDIDLIFIKIADLKSNISEMHVPHKREFIEKKAGPRNKTFFIPFFREAGLKKFAKQLEKETDKFVKQRIPETVFDYISKDEMKLIRKKINSMDGITSIR